MRGCWLTRPPPACRLRSGLAGLILQKLGYREHWQKPVARERLSAALLSVDQADNGNNLAAELLDSPDRLQRRPRGCDDVVHHHDFVTGVQLPLDALASAMPFRLFPDDKGRKWLTLGMADRR